MTLKNDVNKTIDDVKDAASEAVHHSAADAEKARRESQRDEMTSSEKLDSLASEGKERTQAGIDHAKRSVRDNT